MSLVEQGCPDCDVPLVVATCSACNHPRKFHGTLFEVTEHIRRQGWRTRPGARASDPMQWVCPVCKEKR